MNFSCPDNSTFENNMCIANGSCPSGMNYDTNFNMCMSKPIIDISVVKQILENRSFKSSTLPPTYIFFGEFIYDDIFAMYFKNARGTTYMVPMAYNQTLYIPGGFVLRSEYVSNEDTKVFVDASSGNVSIEYKGVNFLS